VPVRARRAKARERLPSYRELASRNPQAEPAPTFLIVSAFPRTVSPSTGSCPASAVLRASFWLAPCISNRPCDLPGNKTRDASDRLLPPERFTCTRTSCVPSSLRDFRRVDTPRSLGLRAVLLGDRVFHDTRERFGGPQLDTRCHIASVCSPYRFRCVSFSERGRFLPTAPAIDRASDTSVASPSSAGCRSAFASPSALALASVIAFPREEAAKVAVTTFS